MLGLFGFFYVSLHFLTYLVLDQFFTWEYIIEDIVDRPYILFGFTAFVCLIPLAITSTNGMVKRLGGKRWQQLHKLVYAIAILGLFHYYLGVKADITWPAVYGLVLSVLLGYRWFRFRIPIRSLSRPAANFRGAGDEG
jgi:sulfoxide reductase heme-binding subunit YedZ